MASEIEKYTKDLLLMTMRNYSQYHWANNWIADLEYDMWSYVCGDAESMWKTSFGDGLRPEDRERLMDLAIEADGWYAWPDNKDHEEFMSMKNWLKSYKSWRDARGN